MTGVLAVVAYLLVVAVSAILAVQDNPSGRLSAALFAVFVGRLMRESLGFEGAFLTDPFTHAEWFLSIGPLFAVVVSVVASDYFRE